ncbi:MAG TPA: NADH-ubiquinone oxidoreductase-F iron-sulfur binding region domain-containing protein, partial [Spirochaetia bacterium]
RDGMCVVDAARRILDKARAESCGKCVFCREGTIQLSLLLQDGTSGKGQSDDLELLAELASVVRDNAGCEMAARAAGALASLMEKYPEEFEQHWKRGRCSALQCTAYFTVHILPDRCTGCGACRTACPVTAIAGDQGLVHVVDQQRCTRCGACIDACEPVARAIVKAGAVKPRTPDSPIPVGSWGEEGGGRRRRRRGDTEGSAEG